MKQQKRIITKKSKTKIPNVIFPISVQTQSKRKTQKLNNCFFRQIQIDSQTNNQVDNIPMIQKGQKRSRKVIRFNSLTKLIKDAEQEFVEQKKKTKSRSRNKKHSDISYPDNTIFQTKSCKRLIHRSLTKARSLTGKNTLEDSHQQNNVKRRQKQRSLTKLESQWIKGRDFEKQKQKQKIHQFDTQKIGRTYDHLGKLKKTTLHKGILKKQFPSLKTLSKNLYNIQKSQFQNAQRDFNKKFKNHVNFQKEESKITENQYNIQRDSSKKFPSPKIPKKNYLKVNPLYGNSKKQKSGRHKKDANFRASADQPLFINRYQNQDPQENLKEESFHSDLNYGQTNKNTAGLDKNKMSLLNEQISQSDQQMFQKAGISQNSQTLIFDKVYFFSSKLSTGFASLFSIERINMKSIANQKFIIEIVIKAYEQILVQKIVYNKSKRCETLKMLKPSIQKDHQKQKLKNELFSELILKKQMMKNRQSMPEELIINSQKLNLLRNTGVNDYFALQNYSGHTIQAPGKMNDLRVSESKTPISSINFSKVSIQCYQSLIEYIQKFCKLQVSYLGASLKQNESSIPLMNQLMKKKHSQMQQTLLQSLNLARVFYFVIKINTTYYVGKSVIIASKKIKHFLLYEFSNMIRHSKNCIIEEQEDINSDHGQLMELRKYQIVKYMYEKITKFFNSGSITHFKLAKTKQDKLSNTEQQQLQKSNIPLINALELCFGTMRQIGLACQFNIESDRFYRIIQSNYRNDVRWQKRQYQFSQNITHQNFFTFHNAFDCGILNNVSYPTFKQAVNINRPILLSNYFECQGLRQRNQFKFDFQYFITKKFQIHFFIFNKFSIIKNHVKKVRFLDIKDKFRQQQFLLLHLIEDHKTSQILNSFLKKQYLKRISSEIDQSFNATHNCRPLFNVIKNKKYYVSVYIPFLQRIDLSKQKKSNQMMQFIYITIESKVTLKRYSLKISLEEVFNQMKEYHRLYSDSRNYRKYLQYVKNIKKKMYSVNKQLFIEKLKFFISKLQLLKKNTYSQFFFIPLPNLISDASYRASSIKPLQQTKHQLQWNSMIARQNQKSLIIAALSKLQYSMRQQEKSSKSVSHSIRIKNFPTYQIYYKSIKKLIPGYYVIVSIYFAPIFDLSQIKFYISKIQKSFYVSIKKTVKQAEYQKLILIFMEFLKDKFFSKIMSKQSEKLSSKYKQFYSKMIRQAETPFISKTRKNKDTLGFSSIQISTRRNNRGAKKNYSINEVQFVELTQQLLCKVFQSKGNNKYLIRLTFPSCQEYVQQQKRKGIDEIINIAIFKQNSMLIYKFQTTARRLLSKKITHKFNVIQLQYQQKNKPFYILFEQIKFLIEQSDQSTYGLLNTFRSYFLDKHYNNLASSNMVSVFSINLLAGISNNLLGSDNFLGGTLNKINQYKFESQKELNLKEVHSNMYQRYCLFIQGNQMLEVLKKRRKYSNRFQNVSNYDINSTSAISEKSRSKKQVFIRKGDRNQSIQASLPKDCSILKTNKIKNQLRRSGNSKQKSPSIQHKIDFMIEDTYYIHGAGSNQVEEQQNYDEKIVYLINKQTQLVEQIQSSWEDQGFTINVPFSKYNKKMFRRFFRNIAFNSPQEEDSEQNLTHTFNFQQMS